MQDETSMKFDDWQQKKKDKDWGCYSSPLPDLRRDQPCGLKDKQAPPLRSGMRDVDKDLSRGTYRAPL